MRKIAYFTICSANYLAYALTLARSLAEADQGRRLRVFLCDRLPADVEVPSTHIDLVSIEDLAIDGFPDMAFRYSILELNTAVKPFCFERLLAGEGFDAAVYLDPDILVLNPLDRVHEALEEGASCVLTPHITSGVNDGRRPDEDSYLTCGIFNLGFAAFSNSDEALGFLRWWQGKTRRHCLVAIDRGIFTDQSYCDLAPCFIDRFVALRDTSYNVAYWNLMQRTVGQDGGRLTIDGQPARFIHFSGIVPDSRTVFSRHQVRFTRRNIGALKPVTNRYVSDLAAADAHPLGRYSAIPYAFARMSNGDAITDAMRAAYRTFADALDPGVDPFSLDEVPFIRLDERYPRQEGAEISVLYASLWEARPDLKVAFDLRTQEGQRDFVDWAWQNLSDQTGLSRRYLTPPVNRPPAKRNEVLPEERRAFRDEIFDKAISSSNFMIRNLLRRYLLGKARTRAYWQRRLAPTDSPVADGAEMPGSGIDIFGYFRAETGIGQGARGFAHALTSERVPFNTNLLDAPGEFQNVVEFEHIRSCETTDTALICANADIAMQLDRHVDPRLIRGRRRIGHWAWELPVFPAAWSAAFDRLDEIWVPSRFVARAVQSATTKPVFVVPYVVERQAQTSAVARKDLGLDEDAFHFLTVFDLSSFSTRKNPLGAIRAFRDAFPDTGKRAARLVVKFHGVERYQGAREEIAKAAGGDRRIRLIDEVYTHDQMSRLRAACDAFVSLHRSEGFGLNIAEAMAAGMTAIATDFSGNQDFLNADNGIPVPYAMRRVEEGEYPRGSGQWWAEPDHDAAVEAMRWAVANPAAARKLADAGREDIASRFSPRAIGSIVLEALAGRPVIAVR